MSSETTIFTIRDNDSRTELPAVPTAAPGTVSAQIANCEFVAAVAEGVGGDAEAALQAANVAAAAAGDAQVVADAALLQAGEALTAANLVTICATYPDIQSGNPIFLSAPNFAATLVEVRIAVVGNPGATTVFTPSIGGVDVEGGAVSVGAAEGNGVVKHATPLGLGSNDVTARQAVKLLCDGASTVATPAHVSMDFQRTT